MSFELNYKKPIPTEKETREKILITAGAIGCQREAKNILAFFDNQRNIEKRDPVAIGKIAEACVLELYKLDQRLVSWLVNENGEIVVGNKVVLKLTNKINLF